MTDILFEHSYEMIERVKGIVTEVQPGQLRFDAVPFTQKQRLQCWKCELEINEAWGRPCLPISQGGAE